MKHEFYDEKGHYIEEYDNGYVFVDGQCVQEPGTDADFDTYAAEVMNGDGYYDSNGHFVRFPDGDAITRYGCMGYDDDIDPDDL